MGVGLRRRRRRGPEQARDVQPEHAQAALRDLLAIQGSPGRGWSSSCSWSHPSVAVRQADCGPGVDPPGIGGMSSQSLTSLLGEF